MPHVYISKVEAGQVSVGVENLARIAKALKVEPYLLLKQGGWSEVE